MLFSIAVFLSASLLFLVEPMFARMVLPKIGGAPAVWNTCVVFYQLALLGGYGYAHLLASRATSRVQVIVHLAVLLTAIVVLPLHVDAAWVPPVSENPAGAVMLLLLRSLGLPFFALAASGPLLQRWSVSRRGATDPYTLYAASNAGSLVALLAYPFAIEPALRLQQQAAMWSVGYGLFVALAGACGYMLVRTPSVARAGTAAAPAASTPSDERWQERLEWLALALVPSSLMLSVTTFISTDIAAIPLLWIVPLAIYLLTLIVAFADRQVIPRRAIDIGFPMSVIAIVMLALGGNSMLPIRIVIPAHMAAFAIVALACHRALAARRPESARLTEFYLWVAAGGAAGGLFNTLIAPRLFVTPLEYPLTAIATCLLFPAVGASPATRSRVALRVATTLVPVTLLVVLTLAVRAIASWTTLPTLLKYGLGGGPALVACLMLWRSPVRLGLALATVFLAGSFLERDDRITLHIERTFFGVHRVTFDGENRVLMSGTTNHGAQSAKPEMKCEPVTYYARRSPIGKVFDTVSQSSTARFGVVGLGTASLAGYARPGQSWTFFEINPAVERLARDPSYFSYLSDCAPQAQVVLGDARLSLERLPDSSFDLLVLDAFSSDAIPVHLLTREALQIYFTKLAPGGILALHVSNRYLDLSPVVAALARDLQLVTAMQYYRPRDEDYAWNAQVSTTRWIVAARQASDIEELTRGSDWRPLPMTEASLWTDDYSNVVAQLRRPGENLGP